MRICRFTTRPVIVIYIKLKKCCLKICPRAFSLMLLKSVFIPHPSLHSWWPHPNLQLSILRNTNLFVCPRDLSVFTQRPPFSRSLWTPSLGKQHNQGRLIEKRIYFGVWLQRESPGWQDRNGSGWQKKEAERSYFKCVQEAVSAGSRARLQALEAPPLMTTSSWKASDQAFEYLSPRGMFLILDSPPKETSPPKLSFLLHLSEASEAPWVNTFVVNIACPLKLTFQWQSICSLLVGSLNVLCISGS